MSPHPQPQPLPASPRYADSERGTSLDSLAPPSSFPAALFETKRPLLTPSGPSSATIQDKANRAMLLSEHDRNALWLILLASFGETDTKDQVLNRIANSVFNLKLAPERLDPSELADYLENLELTNNLSHGREPKSGRQERVVGECSQRLGLVTSGLNGQQHLVADDAASNVLAGVIQALLEQLEETIGTMECATNTLQVGDRPIRRSSLAKMRMELERAKVTKAQLEDAIAKLRTELNFDARRRLHEVVEGCDPYVKMSVEEGRPEYAQMIHEDHAVTESAVYQDLLERYKHVSKNLTILTRREKLRDGTVPEKVPEDSESSLAGPLMPTAASTSLSQNHPAPTKLKDLKRSTGGQGDGLGPQLRSAPPNKKFKRSAPKLKHV
ncbi:hypothetical protein CYLTODRAFT_490250 [Cylindrobasidium torrendii FP15055 ss-10]|uniref:Uncharacterized protein n=1 Tax=Cylindrobasidium torrendii FP15055 ss-10 TaxID=1314674 RepID=A0A0D7BE21_9AGAR|nr:hypothetical protein CYLTODRAFT_490250 [Cylindrobasidium torrendii FP15055 ss-10]